MNLAKQWAFGMLNDYLGEQADRKKLNASLEANYMKSGGGLNEAGLRYGSEGGSMLQPDYANGMAGSAYGGDSATQLAIGANQQQKKRYGDDSS